MFYCSTTFFVVTLYNLIITCVSAIYIVIQFASVISGKYVSGNKKIRVLALKLTDKIKYIKY